MKYLTFALGLAAAGCSFHVTGDDAGAGGGGDGGDVIDLSMPGGDLSGGGGGGGGGSGVDLAMGNDLALPIVCTAGSSSCSGSTLVTCPDGTAQMMTTCSLGCSTMGGPHCELMYPRAPITRNDFDTTGLTAVTLSANSVYIGADTGLIGPGTAPIRHANAVATNYEVHDGVGYHLVAIPGSTIKLGIYTFSSLTVNANVVINAYGTNGIALVSAADLVMNGQFDATCAGNVALSGLFGATPRPYLGGPGGGNGGQPNIASVGFGSTRVGGVNADVARAGGGGGGAYADSGGTGGADGMNLGGASGPTYGDAMLTVLFGGSGGGAGGQNGSGNMSFGGGGGGLALMVAQNTLTIGAGNQAGGVNAGGCGGTANSTVGGGAGGSGGAILVQALNVHLAAQGVLAANGGSGAAGNAAPAKATNGNPGAFGAAAAAGGKTGGNGDGGDGGNGTTTNGSDGGSAGGGAGGAGASVGRIRIESQSGAATLDTGYVISPSAALGTVDIH